MSQHVKRHLESVNAGASYDGLCERHGVDKINTVDQKLAPIGDDTTQALFGINDPSDDGPTDEQLDALMTLLFGPETVSDDQVG